LLKIISLRDEIHGISNILNYTDNEFKEVNKNQWEQVIRAIEDAFIARKTHNSLITLYWEHLKGECYTLQFPNDNAFTILDKLIHKDEKVWFLAQDTHKVWLYEGFIEHIINIIKECYAFEYYIVSKKYIWLLCENHHGCLTGIGNEVIERMKKLNIKRSKL
jgi:hypothetical protein